jgi:mRNA-degrading endonuclease RelE of RelBE toxin-antitoxin system
MKINISKEFLFILENQVRYIAADKPIAAKKFKKDLLISIKKDIINPFHFKKSIYYDDESIRDYVFKGYTSVYKVDEQNQIITVFGFIKHKETI